MDRRLERLAEVEKEREDERFEWRKESEAGSAESRLRLHMETHRLLQDDRQKILRDNKRIEADLIEENREHVALDHEFTTEIAAHAVTRARVVVLEAREGCHRCLLTIDALKDRVRSFEESRDLCLSEKSPLDSMAKAVVRGFFVAPTTPPEEPEPPTTDKESGDE